MPTIQYGVTVSGGGGSISQQVARTCDGAGTREITLAASQAGSLTTRTDNTHGTITMTSGGHTITTAELVDLYWTGGRRYNVVVGTVSGTSVPFSGGSGDNLPSTSTAIQVAPQIRCDMGIVASEIVIISALFRDPTNPNNTTDRCHIDWQDNANSELAAQDYKVHVPQVFDIAGGASNPFSSTIDHIMASNGSATDSLVLDVVWGVNA
jgi:hypothetical protein